MRLNRRLLSELILIRSFYSSMHNLDFVIVSCFPLLSDIFKIKNSVVINQYWCLLIKFQLFCFEDVTFYHDFKWCSHINEKRLKALNLKSFLSIVLKNFPLFNYLHMKIMWKHRKYVQILTVCKLLSILSIFSCWYFP